MINGAALPPIFTKLLKQIEQGNFIEVGELLPKRLGHLSPDEDYIHISMVSFYIFNPFYLTFIR